MPSVLSWWGLEVGTGMGGRHGQWRQSKAGRGFGLSTPVGKSAGNSITFKKFFFCIF